MARKLGHKCVSGELNKQVGNLRKQQLIKMTLPEKPNSRLQQYRLTLKGQRFLQDAF
ncbi:Fic family protein [Halomonas sp. ATBC28]|uniref:Fic family protein n=1 Tax=Halomonadaceae TaxID=28256 RepID=UPI0032D57D4B